MINEKRKLEYYNYLLKALALIKVIKLFPEKENIENLENHLMEMLNNFENCNFNKINFFSKEEIVTPAIGFILFIKNDNDQYLLLNNQFPFAHFNLYSTIKNDIESFLKKNMIETYDFKLKGIKNKMPLTEFKNTISNKLSMPEYICVLSSRLKSYNNKDVSFINKENIEDTDLFLKEELLNYLSIIENNEFYID